MDCMSVAGAAEPRTGDVHFRLNNDYTSTDDAITLHRGDECVLLNRYDENWLYVSTSDGNCLYVPVTHVEQTSPANGIAQVPHPPAHAVLEQSRPDIDVTTVQSDKPLTPDVYFRLISDYTSPEDGITVQCGAKCQLLTRYDENWVYVNTSDGQSLYVPVTYVEQLSPEDDNDKNVDKNTGAATSHGSANKSLGVVGGAADVWSGVIRSLSMRASRVSSPTTLTPRNTLGSVDDSRIHLNNSRETPPLPVEENDAREEFKSPTTPRADAGTEAPGLASRKDSSASDSVWLQSSDQTLLNKKGAVQCLQTRENGKFVKKPQWSQVYVALRGALVSFYPDEASAKKKPNGSIAMPTATIGLQGALIQYVTSEESTENQAVRITASCNSEYVLKTDTIEELQSWCHHLKNNVAVLLAERTARMESSKPVSTLSAAGSASKGASSSTMSRVAQRLKDLLTRRPTKEELTSRGIYAEPMFGSTLAATCAKDKTIVPIFLTNCFREIERRGLTISGIYRLSGSISKIQKLRIRANQGDYDVTDCEDIHTLTGVVKLYFRELQEPVIPFDFFDRFCNSYKQFGQRAKQDAFRSLLKELPEEHRNALKVLCIHLSKVAEMSGENQMNQHNLSIVFGPTLMWLPVHRDKSITSTLVLQGQVIEFILQEHQQLFTQT